MIAKQVLLKTEYGVKHQDENDNCLAKTGWSGLK